MKAIICPPDKPRYEKAITSFSQLQEAVGGYVEIVRVENDPTKVLAVNEDGQALELPPNKQFPTPPIPLINTPEGAITIGAQLPYILGTVVILPSDWHEQLD